MNKALTKEFYQEKIDEFKKAVANIFELKVDEKSEEKKEVKAEETKAEDKVEEKAPEQKEEVLQEDNKDGIQEMQSNMADLLNRVAKLEAEMGNLISAQSELKKVQSELGKAVMIIADLPSGEEPKITESAFSQEQKNTNRKKGDGSRLQELSKYFVQK